MILGIEISFRILCSHCNSFNQVLGLKTKLTCYNCAKTVNIQQNLANSRVGGIKYHFGAYFDIIREAMAILKEGEKGKESRDQSPKLKFFYRKKMPFCTGCKHPVDAESIYKEETGHITCSKCGKHIPVRKRDGGVRQWDRRIDYVVNDSGESADRFARIERDSGKDGIVVHCKGCGLGLNVDKRNRILSCTQCSLVNIIPDAVWLRISPIPEVEPFFLLINHTPEDLFNAWMYFLHPNQYFLNQNETIHDELREKAADYLRSMEIKDLRTMMAQKGNYVSKELAIGIDGVLINVIDLLVIHEDAKVRRMVFKRDDLPGPVIEWMATRGPLEARVSLTDRRDLSEAVLEILSMDSETRVRSFIALHPDLTKDIMKRLRKDPDKAVRKKIKENVNYRKHFWW